MRSLSTSPWYSVWILLISFCLLCARVAGTPAPAPTQWITYTNEDGQNLRLADNRQPALYTQQFGDCQGGSLITLDRFDAAYYKDNMTVLFHFSGTTPLVNESTMLYMSVYAYGENRFNLTFDPCFSNLGGMCPLNSSVRLDASGILPLSDAEVKSFPDIALAIPDFEGQAIIRIFGNTTQTQIACFSAMLTNGASFSHPTAVGSTIGIFVAIAMISSVAVAIYGQSIPEARKHYAHSLSMFVVFSVLQHVFFTGALSMNFPSVLVAFWSNFGWAAGMIHSKIMQDSINSFVGNHRGNLSLVGSIGTGQTAEHLGGGYDLSQIYKRATDISFNGFKDAGNLHRRTVEDMLQKRTLVNASTGYPWFGGPVGAGLPLPGNFSGFAGTLAELEIPVSNAFLTGLLWFLVMIAFIILGGIILKLTFKTFASYKLFQSDRMKFFQQHWIYFIGITILRTSYIAFFMMIFLTLFQFTFGGGAGVLAIAAIVFAIFFLGVLGVSAYALWYRLKTEDFHNEKDQIQLKKSGFTRESTSREKEDSRPTVLSLPWVHLYFTDPAGRPHVHEDEGYLIRFGWLSARFRKSKWWFFSFWLVYEFVRACFYGGAAGHPMVQVFGLLVWEILSLIAIVIMKPFESNRLNIIMVYLLGFSKVVSVALCSAFDPRFGLNRILTTAIGIIIIVIQGILVICLMIAIVVGAISSYMSVRRNHEEIKPKSLTTPRTKYFAHIEQKATDKPAPPAPPAPRAPRTLLLPRKSRPDPVTSDSVTEVSKETKEPYFAVTSVRRELKIEDQDPDNENKALEDDLTISGDGARGVGSRPLSRTGSVMSNMSGLPYGAKQHRLSWSTRDLQEYNSENGPSNRNSRISFESARGETQIHRQSTRHSITNSASLTNVAQAATVNGRLNRSRHYRSHSNVQTGVNNGQGVPEDEENAIRPDKTSS